MNHRPHLLIFNPDQWRGDVMGHLGNPAAVTPNLDRMAATEAVSFSNAFCQNPVCTPSRCSFMTGWYPHVRGHRTMFHMLHLEHDEPCLLKVLKDAGYFVWWGGKNDLVPHGKEAEVCDMRVSLPGTKTNLHAVGAWRGEPTGDAYYSFYVGELAKDKGEEVYLDSDWANVQAAIEFIESYEGDQPLCIFLALGYPHPPYGVEQPYFEMVDRERLPERIVRDDPSSEPSMLQGIRERQGLQGWTEDRWTELRATYYAMCARVDDQFGQVTEALRRKQIYDDTAVFFFSDHGDYTGDYGLVEKNQNTFEDALVRVPLLVKPPIGDAVVPRTTDTLVELVDFSATVYDLLGLDPGYDSFGRSLLPIVRGETDEHRDAVFCEGGRRVGEHQAKEMGSKAETVPTGLYWPRVGLQQSDQLMYHTKATMCRSKRLKYVARFDEPDELYDLELDPQELRNVADLPDYQAELNQMRCRMHRWYMETCDIVPRQEDRRF